MRRLTDGTPLPSALEMAVLRAFATFGPLTGAEVARKATIDRKAVYTVLGRMEDAGLVEEHERCGGPGAGRSRVFYRLTDLGSAVLDAHRDTPGMRRAG